MKIRLILIPIFIVAGFLACPDLGFTEVVEGRVAEVQAWRSTFQICPEKSNCDLSQVPIYRVLSNTTIEGATNLRDLSLGDRVIVEAEPVNDVLWTVISIHRPSTVMGFARAT